MTSKRMTTAVIVMLSTLALAACGGDGDSDLRAENDGLRMENDGVRGVNDVLRAEGDALRALLRGPDQGASDEDRRNALRMTRTDIVRTGENIGGVLNQLREADDGTGTPLTQAALASTQTALTRVGEALGAAIGSEGENAGALEAAHAALRDANSRVAAADGESSGNAAARTALQQAQISLARAAAALGPLTLDGLRALRSDLAQVRTGLEEVRSAGEEIRKANEDLQALLRGPDQGASGEERMNALGVTRTDITRSGENIGEALDRLQEADDGAETPLTQAALTSTQTALTRVGEALGEAIGSGGGNAGASEAAPAVLFGADAEGGSDGDADEASALEAAYAALDDANAKVAAAEGEAAGSAVARTALQQAQISLAQAAAALAPLAFDELDMLRDDLAEVRFEIRELRTPGLSLFASTTGLSPSVDPQPSLEVTRTPRRVRSDDSDPTSEFRDNADRLMPADAVLYSRGQGERIRPGAAFGSEFPLRTRTVRGDNIDPDDTSDPRDIAVRNARGFVANPVQVPHAVLLQGDDNDADPWHPSEAEWVGTVQIKQDGLKLKAGGRGVPGYLFQRDLNRAPNAGPDGKMGIAGITRSTQITQAHVDQLENVDTLPDPLRTLTGAEVNELTGYVADNCGTAAATDIPCHDDYMDDLTFDFGRPGPDPDGEPGYFWSAKVGLDGRDGPDRDDALANGAPEVVTGGADGSGGVAAEWKKRGPDTGEIAVYMSNYAGVDNKGILDRLEQEDDPGKDEARYLDYMSYGMFGWTDYLTTRVRPGFSQGVPFRLRRVRGHGGQQGERSHRIGRPSYSTAR